MSPSKFAKRPEGSSPADHISTHQPEVKKRTASAERFDDSFHIIKSLSDTTSKTTDMITHTAVQHVTKNGMDMTVRFTARERTETNDVGDLEVEPSWIGVEWFNGTHAADSIPSSPDVNEDLTAMEAEYGTDNRTLSVLDVVEESIETTLFTEEAIAPLSIAAA